MFKISTVAFQARNALRSSGVYIPHSNALELVASSIGYGSYAALKLNPSLDRDNLFPAAEHIVLQADALEQRLQELGLEKPLTQAVSIAIRDAFTREVHNHDRSCRFHTSMSDFQDFIFQDVQEQAFQDNNVSDAYAETNAYIDEFYADDYEFDTLAKSDEVWTLVATGTHTGEVDEDRVYHGHAGNFTATYTFKKDGRCGLVLLDLEFGLDFERSYDRDDEE